VSPSKSCPQWGDNAEEGPGGKKRKNVKAGYLEGEIGGFMEGRRGEASDRREARVRGRPSNLFPERETQQREEEKK